MLIVDKLLIGGIRFVLDKVATAVEQELNDDTTLREQLLEAQMKLELGEMSQADFDVFESDILVRLRQIQERKQGGALGPIEFKRGEAIEGQESGDTEYRVTGIEATLDWEEAGDGAPSAPPRDEEEK
jgi:hypothetical protein